MNENRCVCCGEIIPEGRMICWNCEHNSDNKYDTEEKVEEDSNVTFISKTT